MLKTLQRDYKRLVIEWMSRGKISDCYIGHIRDAYSKLDLNEAIAAQGV